MKYDLKISTTLPDLKKYCSRWAGVQDSEDPLWNDNHSSISLNCCDLAELLKVQ